jgi:hypothetical protein
MSYSLINLIDCDCINDLTVLIQSYFVELLHIPGSLFKSIGLSLEGQEHGVLENCLRSSEFLLCYGVSEGLEFFDNVLEQQGSLISCTLDLDSK